MGKKLIIKGADFSANCIGKDEYNRLLWVMSNSTNQHFELPTKVSANKRIEIDFSVPQSLLDLDPTETVRHHTCGSVGDTADIFIAFFKYSTNPSGMPNNNMICGFCIANDKYAGKITDTNMHTVSICRNSIQLDNNTAIDISSDNSSLDNSETATKNLWCMGCNAATGGQSSDIHIHGIRVYSDYTDNGTIEINAFPVKKTSNNKVYMYESVNGIYIPTSDGNDPLYSTL